MTLQASEEIIQDRKRKEEVLGQVIGSPIGQVIGLPIGQLIGFHLGQGIGFHLGQGIGFLIGMVRGLPIGRGIVNGSYKPGALASTSPYEVCPNGEGQVAGPWLLPRPYRMEWTVARIACSPRVRERPVWRRLS